MPITVSGTDALGQPFKERTTTITVNCHGCRYQSKHYVLRNSIVTFEIPHPESGRSARAVKARVMWVQRPRTVQELFQVGAQLEIPGNVWGVAFPPDDWFPFPEEEGPSIPAPAAAQPAPPAQAPAAAPPTAPAGKVRMLPAPAAVEEEAFARQMAKVVADAKQQLQDAVRQTVSSAVTTEIGEVLRQVEGQLRASAKKTVEVVAQQHLESVLNKAEEKIENQRRTAVHAIREQWMSEFNEELQSLRQKLAEELGSASSSARESFLKDLETRMTQSAERLAEVEQHMTAVRTELGAAAAGARAQLAALQGEIESLTAQSSEQWRTRIEAEVQKSRERQAELEEAAKRLHTEMAAASTAARGQLASLHAEIETLTAQRSEQWRAQIEAQVRESNDRLAELEQAARKLHTEMARVMEAEVPKLHGAWREKLESDMAVAGTQWNALVNSAVTGAVERLVKRFSELTRESVARTEQEAGARVASARESLEHAAGETQRALVATRELLARESEEFRRETERARAGLDELRQATARAEEYPGRIQAASQAAADDLNRRLQEMVTFHAAEMEGRSRSVVEEMEGRAQSTIAEMERRSEGVIASMAERLEPALAQKSQEALARFGGELDALAGPKFEQARQTIESLAAAQQRVEEAARELRERLHRVTEEYVRESQTRMQETVVLVQKEFESASRLSMAKWLEDLDAKSTEAQHTTFEALYKSAEWYQKKAQTSMQTALEKALEQASNNLRERAGEVSRTFAMELDHYSRSYAEHTQGLLDDASREMMRRIGGQLDRTAEAKGASFSDEVHRIASEKLENFAESSSATRDEVAAALERHAENVRTRWQEFSGQSFTEFQDRLATRVAESVASAQQDFRASLQPILDGWRAEREEQQREWMEKMGTLSNEAVEGYKERLGNASNSWLVTSVATLNEHAQTALDALAKNAEQRLRDTCSGVLMGLAETMRRQLLGLSADLAGEPPKEPK